MMTQTKQLQSVHTATAGVAFIAAVAFVISYSALQQTAASYGFPGWQSWLWPLLIDLPILVFALTSLVVEWLTGRRSWFATSMIILFSVATIMFNLAHAEIHWLHYAVAVMPPLAVIVTFEALRELIQIVAAQQPPATARQHSRLAAMVTQPHAPAQASASPSKAPSRPQPPANGQADAPRAGALISLSQAQAALLTVADNYGASKKQKQNIEAELTPRADAFPMDLETLLTEVRQIAQANGVPALFLGSLTRQVKQQLAEATPTAPPPADAAHAPARPAESPLEPPAEEETEKAWYGWSDETRAERIQTWRAEGRSWRQIAKDAGGVSSSTPSRWWDNNGHRFPQETSENGHG